MSATVSKDRETFSSNRFFYGWIIVVICTLMITVGTGLMYSYSVFFKPLVDFFSSDRATVSLIYSASLIIRGAFSIAVGWLADKYGPAIISIFCGFMIGLGLVLSSQVHTMWQFFLTYAVIEAIGLSGAFGVGTAIVSRWFTKKRGMALGIVSMGSGFGTIFIVPVVERLLNAFAWSQTFIICGVAGGMIIVVGACFLRPAPQTNIPTKEDISPEAKIDKDTPTRKENATLCVAIHMPETIMILSLFFCFIFCVQIIMVHLVNYATDMGVTPLMATTLLGIIGAVSIAGRLSTGIAADKIGAMNLLIITPILILASFIILIFSKSLWSFYIFAAVFGFAYGSEVPQVPLVVERYFGTKSMATLVGLVLFAGNLGGALGPWIAGIIFDSTQGYQWAFILGAIVSLASLIPVLILRKQRKEIDSGNCINS